MSKFIDKLNRVSLAASQRMGFGPIQPAQEQPKILLVASLACTDVAGSADYVAGADAGLLHISDLSSGAEAIQKASQLVPDIPWGAWLKDADKEGIEQLAKAGCDFIVFPAASTSLAIIQNNDVGRILVVEASLKDGLLRAINELPVDTVLIAGEHEGESTLTWHHLMLFRRFADLLTKPLLASIPPNITGSELQTLWEAGVKGIVVEAGAGQPAERFKELRQTVDSLTFSSPHKRKKIDALLPHIKGETDTIVEEEEEEEEE